jgi:hypothetical protein
MQPAAVVSLRCPRRCCARADRAAAPPSPRPQRALAWAEDIARMVIRSCIDKSAKKGSRTHTSSNTSESFDKAVLYECRLRKEFPAVAPASSATPARQRREPPRASRGELAALLAERFEELVPKITKVIVELADEAALDIFGVSEAALIHTFSAGAAGACVRLGCLLGTRSSAAPIVSGANLLVLELPRPIAAGSIVGKRC